MATGSGKTFTAVTFVYRLVKFAKARRVLFLVDRNNLGRQALREFQQYVTPDDGRKFSELYNVQRLASNVLDPVSKVCITTIQRLYSMLSGEPELDAQVEERSLFEMEAELHKLDPREVRYNPSLPIEYFDFVITDECHRSIYHLWRQVLEYFDATIVGLTATPSKQTLGFFNQNLVMEYPRERAVADGVNVDGEVYRIRTEITERGSKVEAGFWVDRRDRQTRATRWEQLDEDLEYAAGELDNTVVSEGQIRLIVRTFRDRLFTELYPGRTEVPKTLIFAKDDSHAEDIVRIVREEFGKGNEFCKKITYRVTGVDTDDLIAEFRNSYFPRIAVSVDMISTGTDIKPLEILLFMRPVRSRVLYEQMLGRGTRVIQPTDLQAVTPDTLHKTRFVIVDAVGVVDNPKHDTQTLERKRSVPFEKLLELVALGVWDDDILATLAGRLASLQRNASAYDAAAIEAAGGGLSLGELAHRLLDAVDPDKHVERAVAGCGTPEVSPEQVAQAAAALSAEAAALFDDPYLRTLLVDAHRRAEQTIDTISADRLTEAQFSDEEAGQTVESFRQVHRGESRRDCRAADHLRPAVWAAAPHPEAGQGACRADPAPTQHLDHRKAVARLCPAGAGPRAQGGRAPPAHRPGVLGAPRRPDGRRAGALSGPGAAPLRGLAGAEPGPGPPVQRGAALVAGPDCPGHRRQPGDRPGGLSGGGAVQPGWLDCRAAAVRRGLADSAGRDEPRIGPVGARHPRRPIRQQREL